MAKVNERGTPASGVVKAATTDKERDAIATAQAAGDAAPALAFASLRPGLEGIVGRSGYERLAQDHLSSKPGYTTYFASRLGSVISIPPDGYRAGAEGDDLRLSIDIVIHVCLSIASTMVPSWCSLAWMPVSAMKRKGLPSRRVRRPACRLGALKKVARASRA